MSRKAITIPGAPSPAGPYSHGWVTGNLVWVSGQIGRDPVTGEIVGGGFEAELTQAITNVETILGAAGTTLGHVVWAQIEYLDPSDLETLNRVYGQRFSEPYPARISFCPKVIWKAARVMINCVATLPD